MPVPPEGAQFTIYCLTVSGPEHVARANRFREQLVAHGAMKDWYVIHSEGHSTIYYGFYRAFNDAKDADSRRAQEDRRRIDAMTDRLGNRPFKFAFFVALDAPDPVAPPEWNLESARGAYSLQIAAYTGSPLRKQFAVDAVRAARAQGVEAYYYHGETTSSVTIGAFPETAVRSRQIVANATGDPEQTFLTTPEPLPEYLTRGLVDRDNNPIRVVQERPEVTDPKLIETMRRFPEHAVNGEVPLATYVDPETRQKVVKPASSFVVPIPKPADSPLSAGTGDEEAPALQPRPSEPGVGQLPGIRP
jgi:hypothetical protein